MTYYISTRTSFLPCSLDNKDKQCDVNIVTTGSNIDKIISKTIYDIDNRFHVYLSSVFPHDIYPPSNCNHSNQERICIRYDELFDIFKNKGHYVINHETYTIHQITINS